MPEVHRIGGRVGARDSGTDRSASPGEDHCDASTGSWSGSAEAALDSSARSGLCAESPPTLKLLDSLGAGQ